MQPETNGIHVECNTSHEINEVKKGQCLADSIKFFKTLNEYVSNFVSF